MRWAQRTVAIGLVLDVTERRGLERTLVVRSSVTEALSRWRSLDPGAVELLRAIATSMGFLLGVIWVFDGGVFVPRAIWHQPSPSLESLAASIRDWTPGLGSPTIGTAYATGTTAFSTDVLASASPERAAALRVAGITGAVAIPAVYEGETLAVLAFVASEPLDDEGPVGACVPRDRARGRLLPLPPSRRARCSDPEPSRDRDPSAGRPRRLDGCDLGDVAAESSDDQAAL